MKKIAIILLILLLLCAGVVGYGLFHTNLQVIAKGVQMVPASERPTEFAALQEAVRNQSLLGTQLRSGELSGSENYSYYMYTLRLKNAGLVNAEMVEVQIAPIDGDVLFYGETTEVQIKPGETKDVWCVLLTQGNPHPVRDIYVTYYLWGHPQEVKYTYDNVS
ncbi:MAG: hypothetical protein IJ189_11200 [Clostridia bacterium]|nr:hypothetical protein [Clostridia bacterium]